MPDKQPNIVLIMSDDLGYEVIGANGGTSYATPRIDRMAQEGMRFAEAGPGDLMLEVGNFLAHRRWAAGPLRSRERGECKERVSCYPSRFFTRVHGLERAGVGVA